MFFLYFRFQPLFDVINFLIGYAAGTRKCSSDTDQLPCPMRCSSRRLIELLGSLSLILGFSRAAAIMFVYMIPVTFAFHTLMSTNFAKNLGIMGGLLMIAAYGSGIDSLSDRV